MARKSAQSVAAAKEWFSLGKYQPTGNFGPFHWMEQIKKRVDIEAAFNKKDKSYLDHAIPSLTDNPLAHCLVAPEFMLSLDGKPLQPIVRDLDLSDLEWLQKMVEKHANTMVSRPSATLKQLQLRPAAQGIAPSSTRSYLAIRLDSKDNEIIEAFKTWLKERRQLTPEAIRNEWAEAFESAADLHELEGAAEIQKMKSALEAADMKLATRIEKLKSEGKLAGFESIGELKELKPADLNTELKAALLNQLNNEFPISVKEMGALLRESASMVREGVLNPSERLVPGIQVRFYDWFDRKIIPYFDLQAWGRWSGSRLSDAEIAALLFSSTNPDRDADLKPTKKLAAEVFKEPMVMELFRLGAGRSAE